MRLSKIWLIKTTFGKKNGHNNKIQNLGIMLFNIIFWIGKKLQSFFQQHLKN